MNKAPHVRLFSLYPLFQLGLVFSAGIFIADTVQFKLNAVLAMGVVCSLLAPLLLLKKKLTVAGPLLLTAFLLAGAALASLEQRKALNGSLKRTLDDVAGQGSISLTGILDEQPEFATDRMYLILRVEQIQNSGQPQSIAGRVSLLASFNTATSEQEYRFLGLRYGTRIRVRARINPTDRYRNPGVSTVTSFLDVQGLDGVGFIASPASIVRLGEAPVFKPLVWLFEWRNTLQRKIDQTFSADTAGVLTAALLGNRYNLAKASADRFREGGTFHVLVISGMHISFIGGLVFLLVRRLTRRRITQFVVGAFVVWSYSLAVGAGSSVVRAACMFTLIALAQVVFRSASALNSLGAAALFLLTSRPKGLFDPSAQLTFLSVLGILTLAWPIIKTCRAVGSWRPTSATPFPPSCSPHLKSLCEALYWSDADWRKELDRASHSYRLFKTPYASWLESHYLQRFVRYVANAVITSTSVQIFLLPFLIVYFHRISWSSLILNVFISVLLALLCFAALVAMVFSAFSLTVAIPFIKLAELFEWIMIHSVDPFSRLGVAATRLPEYSGWSVSVYLIYYVPLIFLLVRLSRWNPFEINSSRTTARLVSLVLLIQMFAIGIVIFHPLSAGRPTGKLRIDFLDVGQGDAALVTMPDGATVLVDGGGRPSFLWSDKEMSRDVRTIGEMVVSEYLWWRGLDSVDYVLATHADADHIDGLNDVVHNFKVRGALVGRTPGDDAEFAKFANTLRTTRTPVEVIEAGDVLEFGDVRVRVLWPLAADSKAPSGNNDSVVLRLELGAISILLTGDIEKEAESQILTNSNNISVNVIKVPHHGSRTSSTESFVVAAKPQFAIISVGQQSMFGHPHKEVVERWQRIGAQVLRTGKCGTITVETDGTTVSVEKFVN